MPGSRFRSPGPGLYWRFRASFTLAAQAAGLVGLNKIRDEWDADTAVRLLQAADRAKTGLPGWYFGSTASILADIRFGAAEAQLAKARRTVLKGSPADRMQAQYDTYEALDMYWLAASSINGIDHPGWTRRIGQRYLQASAFLETLRDDDDPVWLNQVRHLAWFKTILPQLDKIALGEVPGNP
jgi:hypothetical protein